MHHSLAEQQSKARCIIVRMCSYREKCTQKAKSIKISIVKTITNMSAAHIQTNDLSKKIKISVAGKVIVQTYRQTH